MSVAIRWSWTAGFRCECKEKTLADSVRRIVQRGAMALAEMNKSFFILFFKKEHSFFRAFR
jgi:hypothetical protein